MTVTETLFRYHGADGVPLAGFLWRAEREPKALLQLAHGAGEHAGRYRDRLAPLAEAGFAIYAADHRGHGLTSGMSHFGDFGPGGAEACVSDMAELAKRARAEHPGLPLVLMGHSMGAIFAQAFLPEHGGLIDGLVLSGTSGPGPRFAGPPNSAFADPRTDYDWLSRDAAEVDRYIADPFCGIGFTEDSQASFYAVAARARETADLSGLRSGLPVNVFVGDQDPINNRLAAVQPLIDAYRAAGMDVTFKVYPGGRHEMLNETNRDEVISDLLAWLEAHIG
jgi:alpha-beta hydrolase superfamily lysophospholipase